MRAANAGFSLLMLSARLVELVHGSVEVLRGGAEIVDGDVSVDTQLGESVPVRQLEQEIRNSVIIAEW